MEPELTIDGGRRQNEERYNCPICTDNMLLRQPRHLISCRHTFCTECVRELVRRIDWGSTALECPVCRIVTEVPNRDVDRLPLDFTLQEMQDMENRMERERAEHLNQMRLAAQETIQAIYCQVCGEREPAAKCKDCEKKLCETCHRKHIKIPAYADHKVEILCSLHKATINLVCHRCIKALCASCGMLQHADHAEETESLKEAAVKLKKQSEEKINEVTRKFEEFKLHGKTINEKLQMTRIIQQEIRRRTTTFEAVIADAQERLNMIDQACEQPAETLNDIITCTANEIVETLTSLNERHNLPDVEFVNQLKSTKDEAERSLSIMGELMDQNCEEAVVDFAPEDSGNIFKPAEYISNIMLSDIGQQEEHKYGAASQVQMFDHPIMVLDLKSVDNLSLKNPEQIEFLDENLVALVDWVLPYVCVLDQDGDVVAKYYGKEKGQPLRGFYLDGNSVCMVQSNTITKINLGVTSGKEEPVKVVHPKIEKMSKIIFIEEKWIIASFRGDCIYEYNAKDETSKVVAQNLKGPSHVSVFKDGGETKFIVTMRNGHYIAVFDKNWNKVAQLGKEGNEDGQLQWPGGTVVTPDGVVMVTDWKNNRISKFSLDGRFLGHLLTEQDQIRSPMGITLKYPKLWITEQAVDHASIKSFIFDRNGV